MKQVTGKIEIEAMRGNGGGCAFENSDVRQGPAEAADHAPLYVRKRHAIVQHLWQCYERTRPESDHFERLRIASASGLWNNWASSFPPEDIEQAAVEGKS